MTDSMKAAISETERRRKIQEDHNKAHGITPISIVKQIRDLTDRVKIMVADEKGQPRPDTQKPDLNSMAKEDLYKLARELEKEMKTAATNLEFEKAAALRDQLYELRGALALTSADDLVIAADKPERRPASGDGRRRGR